MKRLKRTIWRLPAGLLAVLLLAFLAYTARYYHAETEALSALESDGVRVEKTDYGWFFDGPAGNSALIFYPGGKVEESAYAPLLHALAADGIDVCLVKMPFHLAVFGINKANAIQQRYDYASWYIGGHSLGGAAAAIYAASHGLDGVVLLAAYPTRALDEPMLILYGSEDGVVNRERVSEAERYGQAEIRVIPGGNHAGFGCYGAQRGDNTAGISAEEQQRQSIAAIEAWLETTKR